MNTFRPELTPLEDRALASVTAVTLTPLAPEIARTYLTDGGRTLVVSGGSAADTVTITEARGALTVTGTDGKPSVVYRASNIDTVAVTLRGGNDRIEYITGGELIGVRQLRVDLGDGDDTAFLRWADDGGTAKAGTTAVMSGGAGSDAIGFRVGRLAPGVAVNLRADGGAGNDALSAESIPPARGATLDVALRGGGGNDSIRTSSTDDVSARGRLGSAVRTTLEAARAQNDLPAMAGGVVIGGQLAGVAATGVRERGSAAPVTADDQFHLGSNGKAMTATLAAVLVERGFIKWNTTLGQMFPELRGQMDPAYRNVTLEQLLNHRSGFIDENVSEELFGQILAFRGNGYQTRQTFLKDILATPAGTVGGFYYSNVGYTLAASMMERATGNAYEWLMQKHIFNPLGMTSAGFGPPGSGTGRVDQPRGHNESGASVGNGPGSDAPAALNPAGLVHMSMTDWSKFLRVHLGETVNGVRLLSEASLTKLHTPDPRPTDAPDSLYGFGWVTIQTEFGPALWHNGSNGFWYSEAVIVPSKGLASFAVTNQYSAGAEAAVGAALGGLLARGA